MAVQYTKNYRRAIDSFKERCPLLKDSLRLQYAEAFNSDVFQALLRVKDSAGARAAGIRVYYGLDEKGVVKLLMVPYDNNGNDIITHIVGVPEKPVPGVSPAKTEALTVNGGAQAMEVGQLCPTLCSPTSPLNP
jgi:hypothetical protein